MKKQLVKIGEAAAILGCSISTLRRWEKSGELLPTRKTAGGTRFYSVEYLNGLCKVKDGERNESEKD